MATDDTILPLYWPAVLASAILVTVTAWLVGTVTGWAESNSVLPRSVYLVADGLEHFPMYVYAIAGVILSIGACLGAPDAKTSIILSAKSAFLLIAIPLFATVLSYVATAGSVSSGMESGGLFGVATMAAVLFAFLAGSFSVAVGIWLPVASSAIAACIVIHFILNLINDLPMPWQPAAGETEVDGGQLASDLGLTFAVFFVTAAAFGFIPVLSFPSVGLRATDSVEDIWSKLPSRPSDELWSATAAGRKRIQRRLASVQDDYERAWKNRCTLRSGEALALEINNYFKNVRVFEGWSPGAPLSAPSLQAKALTVKAMDGKLIGWDQLKPHTRIHLDAERYASMTYEFPSDCP